MASGRDTAQDGPGRGRHRRGTSATSRPPRTPIHPAGPEEETDVLPVIAGLFPDAPATGLAKFDLGSIPASVTPPRTWRHAAWFAVAATLLVMVGLTYAAVTLVTNPRKPEVVDALPGLPSYPGLPLELPGDALVSERPSAPAPSSAAPTTASAKPSDRQQLTAPPPGRPTQAPPAATPTAAPPTTTAAASPTRTTVQTPVLVGPVADPEKIGDRTETYFAQVTQDPDAAYSMTTGQARYDGQEELERRYADVTRIEVQRMTIDANRSKTFSTLRLIRKDGSVVTEERELVFTYSSDPKITSDTRTG
ncbi:hypothetical protein SAMN05192558_12251 [Actinokineospora alba]|uniref:Uncharacterized protein n=1 Tax=Actinokineospora alba TaxID=504798 RepID=A0A1H0WJZ8_9PSEU|nr:hypothetical protein [Actinokineospora alba]TDP65413.1 hypothetical protein C8E96_0895 [Actinokineospora alba]SDP90923.1 hypothetical protein SAMN05192558_12251 [Actinokineospora alba]